ncbi:sensor histidine kinase [Alkalihalophilus lindianensis]|uniref:histidine kinase n=1 Tax=Alkalihalophilus lindianensis TaxID=1630542 RepID=A0ABU3XDZ4_9BACI|nr:sensor histidine kinase [Alkalihalophilus lindianensis]MDV2686109.1 sensor histidine kinase [Alkalihalophilus lindianensis]
MQLYWVWLGLLGGAWFFALHHLAAPSDEMPLRILGSAVFFALLFVSTLFKKNQLYFMLILSGVAIVAMLVLWPQQEGAANPYTLLIFSLLAGKALLHLSPWFASGFGLLLFVASLTPQFFGYSIFPPVFLALYTLSFSFAFIAFWKLYRDNREFTDRNEALISEYRKLKRRIAADEKHARQEERTQIARDIHDSVGHKLTALLMQLEVSRLQADEPTASQLQKLKELASESLEETRSAVKTLKQDEVGGLAAIINLIRKLEAENFLRIQFSLKPGALTVPLRNEQMIAVYRAVQEALTNMMRHSQGREVTIMFEAPAGEVFRFEVINPIKNEIPYTEGFGLQAMRERIERCGGQLEVYQSSSQFVVRGTLPIQDIEEGET